MVPEIYLRAEAFPRTTSGKVDRRSLPSPESADLEHTDFRAPQTEVERVLAEIWEDVLGVENVGVDDNFFRLGGHSLLALTMVLRVEASLSKTISIATLFAEPTLGDLARLLDGPESVPTPTTTSRLVLPFTPISARRIGDDELARPPILCVGGFGVHASYLHPIGTALGDAQPFYGIQPLDIDEPMPEVERMEQLASRLADLIQEVQPEGPYTLSGHSAGARLALGIAFELEDRGHRTALVVLDMHAPVEGGADQDKWTSEEGLLDYIRQMKVVLGEALAVDIDATQQMSDEDAWVHIAAVLEREQLLPAGGGVETLRRTVRLRERVFTLLADYVPVRRYPGRFVLLSVADRHRVGLPRIAGEAWQEFCERPIEAHVVPGDHLSMIREPHVEVVAAHLRRIVEETWLSPATPVATSTATTTDDPFKVDWQNSEDAEALWLFDEAHCPEPMTPLDFELRLAPMTAATNRASKLFGLPLSSQPRLINAFVFQRAEIHEVPEDQRDEVWMAADDALRDAGQGLDERWQGEWFPEIQRHLEALATINVDDADLPALLGHLTDLRARIARLWEIHFELMYPVTLALSDYDDAYSDLFGDEGPLAAYELLAGTSSQTTEANVRLWELGREAAAVPALSDLVRNTAPEQLLGSLDASPEGRAFAPKIAAYVAQYGERNDNMYIDRPTWIEDPIAILRGLREAVLQPDRDLGAELRQQGARRAQRVAEVREAIAAHPRPVIDEFEALLAAAQASTHLSEEHNFWIDCKITYYARRICVAIGRRLFAVGVLEDHGDVFYLTLEELAGSAEEGPPVEELRAAIAERKATEVKFTGVKPPPFMGTMRPFLPIDSALMRAMALANGGAVPPSEDPRVLRGSPGAAGRAVGVARIVQTLDEAGKLQPGDILVAAATLPSWTPYFAIASAVVTNSGGMLCHAAVVAREYGIPAVVGTRSATATLRDGQRIEVDGDGGIVRIVEEDGAAT